MSGTDLLTPNQVKDEEVKAEVLDILSSRSGNQYITMGGLKLEGNMMEGIKLGVLVPVTNQGKANLKRYVDYFEEMNRKKYTPVTTLQVEPPAAGGKRNKSKKPKHRNSRSKRRKTLSKRRR